MTYYGGKELAASFRTVRNNTIRDRRRDSRGAGTASSPRPTRAEHRRSCSRTSRSARDSRSTCTARRIDDLKKVDFSQLARQLGAEEAKPRTKAEIVAFLKAEGEKFAAYLEGLPSRSWPSR